MDGPYAAPARQRQLEAGDSPLGLLGNRPERGIGFLPLRGRQAVLMLGLVQPTQALVTLASEQPHPRQHPPAHVEHGPAEVAGAEFAQGAKRRCIVTEGVVGLRREGSSIDDIAQPSGADFVGLGQSPTRPGRIEPPESQPGAHFPDWLLSGQASKLDEGTGIRRGTGQQTNSGCPTARRCVGSLRHRRRFSRFGGSLPDLA